MCQKLGQIVGQILKKEGSARTCICSSSEGNNSGGRIRGSESGWQVHSSFELTLDCPSHSSLAPSDQRGIPTQTTDSQIKESQAIMTWCQILFTMRLQYVSKILTLRRMLQKTWLIAKINLWTNSFQNMYDMLQVKVDRFARNTFFFLQKNA